MLRKRTLCEASQGGNFTDISGAPCHVVFSQGHRKHWNNGVKVLLWRTNIVLNFGKSKHADLPLWKNNCEHRLPGLENWRWLLIVQALHIQTLIFPREAEDLDDEIHFQSLGLQCDAFWNHLATLSHLQTLKIQKTAIHDREDYETDSDYARDELGPLFMTNISVMTKLT